MKLDKEAVVAVLQSALDQVNQLPDVSDSSSDVDALKAQVADLEKKNSDIQAVLDAEVAKEADQASQLAAASDKLQKIKDLLA